jgi:hypothetical protein
MLRLGGCRTALVRVNQCLCGERSGSLCVVIWVYERLGSPFVVCDYVSLSAQHGFVRMISQRGFVSLKRRVTWGFGFT